MEREFESPGWRAPLGLAALLHTAVVLTGVWSPLPAPARAPAELPKPAPLQLVALDALDGARLLSSAAATPRPGLAEPPRQGRGDLRLAPEDPAPAAAASRRPPSPWPAGDRAAPPARLLEARGDPGRGSSRLDRLRPPPRSLGELLGSAPLPAGEQASAPPAPPGQPEPILLEGRVLDALTLYRESPRLGPEAIQAGLAGVVLVEFAVDPEGFVESATVVESGGHGALDQAALSAARRWRFDPRALDRAGQRRCRYRFQIDAQRPPP